VKQLKLHTSVPIEALGFRLSHNDHIMLTGSCFTENMGQRLTAMHFDTLINPFGIMYNPFSMAEALERCLDGNGIGEENLVFRDGLWHSWLHHGSFSRHNKQECLDACNKSINKAHFYLGKCHKIIATFGSAYYYTLKDSSIIVANCHKVPASQFELRLAEVDDIVDVWSSLIERLQKRDIEVLFTVSPVRHNAYGAHGNQLGKATMLLAVEKLCKKYGTSYFPAYEIVVDELRDYRFYADDLSHPSTMAEEIVWQRFQLATMSDETIALCDRYDSENRQAAHRPINSL
jgi:hypothetical protein